MPGGSTCDYSLTPEVEFSLHVRTSDYLKALRLKAKLSKVHGGPWER